MKDLNILIDSMQNERSEIESSISLMENDINYYESDHSRIKTLIENNKAHIIKISTDHRRALNSISNTILTDADYVSDVSSVTGFVSATNTSQIAYNPLRILSSTIFIISLNSSFFRLDNISCVRFVFLMRLL